MGNQVAPRAAWRAPPFAILTGRRSHILGMKAGGVSALCDALIHGVTGSWPLTAII